MTLGHTSNKNLKGYVELETTDGLDMPFTDKYIVLMVYCTGIATQTYSVEATQDEPSYSDFETHLSSYDYTIHQYQPESGEEIPLVPLTDSELKACDREAKRWAENAIEKYDNWDMEDIDA